eukprot:3063610-Pleurochrysis_carterae.AAC.2
MPGIPRAGAADGDADADADADAVADADADAPATPVPVFAGRHAATYEPECIHLRQKMTRSAIRLITSRPRLLISTRTPFAHYESEIMLGKKQQHSKRVQQQQLRMRGCRTRAASSRCMLPPKSNTRRF